MKECGIMKYIIAISGTTGAGKSTIVQELAEQLGGVTLYFDAYQSTTSYPDDMMLRLSRGEFLEPDEIKSPDFYTDLCKLKEGNKVIDPWGRELIPTKYIIVEEPFGRMREGMKEILDFVAFIHIPLDISLARRLLRDVQVEYKDLDPDKKLKIVENFLTAYLNGLRNGYSYDLVTGNLSKTADIILDGLKQAKVNCSEILKLIPGGSK